MTERSAGAAANARDAFGRKAREMATKHAAPLVPERETGMSANLYSLARHSFRVGAEWGYDAGVAAERTDQPWRDGRGFMMVPVRFDQREYDRLLELARQHGCNDDVAREIRGLLAGHLNGAVLMDSKMPRAE